MHLQETWLLVTSSGLSPQRDVCVHLHNIQSSQAALSLSGRASIASLIKAPRLGDAPEQFESRYV